MRQATDTRLRKILKDENIPRGNNNRIAEVMQGWRTFDKTNPHFQKRFQFLEDLFGEIFDISKKNENNERGYLKIARGKKTKGEK